MTFEQRGVALGQRARDWPRLPLLSNANRVRFNAGFSRSWVGMAAEREGDGEHIDEFRRLHVSPLAWPDPGNWSEL
jgi:hypothetical protein